MPSSNCTIPITCAGCHHADPLRPGDYLTAEDDEIEGFKARLNDRLAPTNPTESDLDWDIGDCIAQWWRPNHETFLYPYLPPHCSRPKELKKLYLIHLPETKLLSVPKNMKILAIPLHELYGNTARYGPQLSSIPHYLSKYRFECVNEAGQIEYVTPGGGPLPRGGVKVLAGGMENGAPNGGHGNFGTNEEFIEEIKMEH